MTTPAAPSSATGYADLLAQVGEATIDPDYAIVAARNAGKPPRGSRSVALVVGVTLVGVLLGVAALRTEANRPQVAAERAQLVSQIHERQDRLDALHSEAASLQEEVTALQSSVSAGVNGSQELANQLVSLGISAGAVAVTGPGVQITVDDGASSAGAGSVILDTDLQILVNALWEAGAEAIAIDDHRLTSLTSIRYAGEAITVDYRSLTPPYVISATGNPDTLAGELLQTQGGQTWLGLRSNFGIRFDIDVVDSVTLPGDPHDHLVYARVKGSTT